jgi:hypothetical protein
MNIPRLAMRLLVLGLVLAIFLALEATGVAQCSMCRASLAGSNNPFFIRNFNIGVLVLLTPPVTIFCAIFVVLRRHSSPGGDATDADGHKS